MADSRTIKEFPDSMTAEDIAKAAKLIKIQEVVIKKVDKDMTISCGAYYSLAEKWNRGDTSIKEALIRCIRCVVSYNRGVLKQIKEEIDRYQN